MDAFERKCEMDSQARECEQMQKHVGQEAANKVQQEAATKVHQEAYAHLEHRHACTLEAHAHLELQCHDMRKQVANAAQKGLEALESSTGMQDMNIELQRQCQQLRE